jgi:Zn-dependent protease
MGWSFRIARIAGTDIKVHVTFLLLLGFYALSGGAVVALLILAIFACVLLHEFGHIAMARRFGIRTPDVLLLPIGGLARLERMPEEPRQELLIALAGPAVTLLLAVIFYGVLVANGGAPAFRTLYSAPTTSFVAELYRINVILLVFNLIPAFPMDGGRVLRAFLSRRLGPVRATRIAAGIGQAAAFGLAFLGLSTGNLILVLIAFFIFLGAGAEAAAVETKAAGSGIHVRDMMMTDFRALPVHATLADAAQLLLAGEQREFPVIDNFGALEGLLTRDNLIQGLSARGPGSIVDQAMTRGVPVLAPAVEFASALEQLRASRLPALPVVDGGRLVGLVTMENINDLLLLRRATRGR